jgi:hypothetical protein
MTRDMTQQEFAAACERHGFKRKGFLGYYELPSGVQASVLNAGESRRAQLAYLIAANRKFQKCPICQGPKDKSCPH